jgi:hypothetical protein
MLNKFCRQTGGQIETYTDGQRQAIIKSEIIYFKLQNQ